MVLGAGLFIGAPTQAGEKKSEKTLAEIVDLVMKGGKDKTIDEESGRNLGFPGEVKTKTMRYRGEVCPDGRQHSFNVVVSTESEGRVMPTDILWLAMKLTEKESSRSVDGWLFRLSLAGKLSNAVWVEGEPKVEVIHTVKEINSKEVLRAFEKEKKFFLKDSAGLVFSK